MVPFNKMKEDFNSQSELIRASYIVPATSPAPLSAAGATPPRVDDIRPVLQTTLQAIDSAETFWAAVDPVLRTMCQRRADLYTADRTRTTAMIGIGALAIAIYTFAALFFAIRSVPRPVDRY
jgi:hypothetical protein